MRWVNTMYSFDIIQTLVKCDTRIYMSWSSEAFKNIEVGASIDGMKEQGEFIRSGFNWEQFKEK